VVDPHDLRRTGRCANDEDPHQHIGLCGRRRHRGGGVGRPPRLGGRDGTAWHDLASPKKIGTQRFHQESVTRRRAGEGTPIPPVSRSGDQARRSRRRSVRRGCDTTRRAEPVLRR
jgi:hypothetical protein